MAIVNKVLYGYCSAMGGALTPPLKNICYSTLFHFRDHKIKSPVVFSIYRLEKEGSVTRREADRFLVSLLHEFPDKIRGALRIKRNFKKVYIDEENESPWITAYLDRTKLNGSELYAVLAFLRYPQEYPYIVHEMFLIQKEHPELTFSQCFLIAGGLVNSSGHSLCNTYGFEGILGGEFKRRFKAYSLLDRWNTLVAEKKDNEPHFKSMGKDYVSRYFSLNGKSDGWGNDIQRGPMQKGSLMSFASHYWLHQAGVGPEPSLVGDEPAEVERIIDDIEEQDNYEWDEQEDPDNNDEDGEEEDEDL